MIKKKKIKKRMAEGLIKGLRHAVEMENGNLKEREQIRSLSCPASK